MKFYADWLLTGNSKGTRGGVRFKLFEANTFKYLKNLVKTRVNETSECFRGK